MKQSKITQEFNENAPASKTPEEHESLDLTYEMRDKEGIGDTVRRQHAEQKQAELWMKKKQEEQIKKRQLSEKKPQETPAKQEKQLSLTLRGSFAQQVEQAAKGQPEAEKSPDRLESFLDRVNNMADGTELDRNNELSRHREL